MMGLSIPANIGNMDVMGAAFAYVKSGWYVGPLTNGSKDPGSILGKGWQHKTSRDPEKIVEWFERGNPGIFLHAGASDALIFDIDDASKLPKELSDMFAESPAPFQSTRPNDPLRGHYIYQMPLGRTIGNGLGKLPRGWGDIRGNSGIIVVAPSEHGSGGHYEWKRTGDVPAISATVDAMLNDSKPAEDVISGSRLMLLFESCTRAERMGLLQAVWEEWDNGIRMGGSRHEITMNAACWIARESLAGMYPLRLAMTELQKRFLWAMSLQGSGKRTLDASEANKEFIGILRWAIAQAETEDLEALRLRIIGNRPFDPFDPTTGLPPEAFKPFQKESLTSAAIDRFKENLVIGSIVEVTPDGRDMTQEEKDEDAVKKAFPILDWEKLWEQEDTEEWIIEPLIPARRLIAIYSDAKLGKSLLMLELAVAISGGLEVLGIQIDRPRRVLYVDFENDPIADVRSRLLDMGYKPADLNNLCYLSFPTLAGLDSEIGSLELMAAISTYKCEVVVVDTVSRAVNGAENDNDTWLSFYRHTGLKLKQSGITLARLDHTGKDPTKGQRGGSAKVGDVDAVWRLTASTENVFKLICEEHRMQIVETELILTRITEPHLRHKVEGAGWMAEADAIEKAILSIMEKAGCPKDIARDDIRKLIKEAKPPIKASTERLARVMRAWKAQP